MRREILKKNLMQNSKIDNVERAMNLTKNQAAKQSQLNDNLNLKALKCRLGQVIIQPTLLVE